MADARDLKSRGGNTVWVRLPPPAPEKKLRKAVFLIKDYWESNTQGSPGHLKNHQIFWVGLPPPAPEKKLRFCLRFAFCKSFGGGACFFSFSGSMKMLAFIGHIRGQTASQTTLWHSFLNLCNFARLLLLPQNL